MNKRVKLNAIIALPVPPPIEAHEISVRIGLGATKINSEGKQTWTVELNASAGCSTNWLKNEKNGIESFVAPCTELTNIDVPVIRLRKLKEFVYSKLSAVNQDSVGKDFNFDLLHVQCDGSDSL